MATFSFSLALHFTRELAFGVLAIAGCVVVQCLLLFWILLAKVQIHFVLVQERMLRQVYEQTNESHPSSDEKRTTKTESNPEVSISAPASVPTPTIETTERQLSPQAQPFELPDAGTASPRPATPAEAPVWQTKALTARKSGGKRSYAVKQVDSLAPSIPPGFGPLKPVSETVNKLAVIPSESAVQLSANAVPFSPSLGLDTSALEAAADPCVSAFDLRPDAAPLSSSEDWNTDASGATETPSSDAVQLSANALPFSSSPDRTPGVLEAEALYATWPTRPAVRPPPGLPSSPKYNENSQPKALSEHVASTPSVFESTMHNEPAGTNKRARRSVIKKVQSAEDQEVETGKDVRPVSPEDIAHSPNVVTTGLDHSKIRPATLDELQHKFVDTTLVRNKPADWPEHTTPAHTPPLNPEHAARDALIIAYNEREATRVVLNTNYTHDCALEFDEKARSYKMRRQELAALMPSGQLSRDDVESFPYLSAKDTLEPKFTTRTTNEISEETNVAPSPPTSSDDDDFQPPPREAPVALPTSSDDEPLQPPPRKAPVALIAKASRAYQVLIQATKNLDEQCPACNSNFCSEGYKGTGKLKLKSAKDLYLKSRGTVADTYDGAELPESLLKQLPEIECCRAPWSLAEERHRSQIT